jgi:uncharacterized protein (TIGR02145 family)
MKKISGIFIVALLVFISLTFCEKPDNILLTAQSNVKFREFDPGPGNNDTTDNIIPVYLNPGLTYGSVTDVEGNIYRTIRIGMQTWMAENLRTTKFNDGTNIRNGFFGYDTRKYGSYWWYDNDRDSYKNSYGALYNWYAVNTKKLCPTGWHVPSDDEWKQLEVHLGMTFEEVNKWTDYIWFDDVVYSRGTDQGDQLKATILWQSDWEGNDDSGTNASGFSAIPGGFIEYGKFYDSGSHAIWWSSTKSDLTDWSGNVVFAVTRELFSTDPGIFRLACWEQKSGLSVRCLKD